MSINKSPERVQDIFNTIAPRYDRLNHILSFGMDRRWKRKTMKRVKPQVEGDILDVCTGTADFAIAYAKTSPDRHVFGVDFSAEMLEEGKKRVENQKLQSRITLIEGDALALPFEDNRFSVVSVSYGIRNTSDANQALSEMVRVCVPGGTVAILEFSMPEKGFFAAIYRFYFRNILPRLGAIISGERLGAYRHLHDSVQDFPQGERLAGMMTNAGLVNIRQFPMTFGTVTLSLGQKPEN